MTNILVTGANGFVGANFIRWLYENGECVISQDDEIFALQRRVKPDILNPLVLSGYDNNVISLYSDIRDRGEIIKIVMQNEIDQIFHFASQPIVQFAYQDPLVTFDTNILGTLNLMEACRLAGVHYGIYIMSTDKVYGSEYPPYTEETSTSGRMGPYEASKSCSEIIARSYGDSYGIRVSIGRACNIYGPLDLNFSRVIPDTIKNIVLNGKYYVFDPTNYIHEREFIYIDDLCRAISYIVATEDTFNIASDEVHNIAEIKDLIADTLGFGEKVEIEDPRDFPEIPRQSMDDTKLRDTFGFENRFSLEDGLKYTTEWYVKYIVDRWDI